MRKALPSKVKVISKVKTKVVLFSNNIKRP